MPPVRTDVDISLRPIAGMISSAEALVPFFEGELPGLVHMVVRDATPDDQTTVAWALPPATLDKSRLWRTEALGIYEWRVAPDGAHVAYHGYKPGERRPDGGVRDTDSVIVRALNVDAPERLLDRRLHVTRQPASMAWSPSGNALAYGYWFPPPQDGVVDPELTSWQLRATRVGADYTGTDADDRLLWAADAKLISTFTPQVLAWDPEIEHAVLLMDRWGQVEREIWWLDLASGQPEQRSSQEHAARVALAGALRDGTHDLGAEAVATS